MNHSPRPRKTAELSKSLQQQLNAYALAAGAAGVGMMALTLPAEAKIIYTPAHKKLRVNQHFSLDLNHDGVIDFVLSPATLRAGRPPGFSSGIPLAGMFATWQGSENGIVGYSGTGGGGIYGYPSALRAGVRIGAENWFLPYTPKGTMAIVVEKTVPRYNALPFYYRDPWANSGKGVRNRYLGLKFAIQGKIHFGWARLNVKVFVDHGNATVDTLLTGYAYETIPGKGIIAGKTKGPDVTTDSPASLGHLATGAYAIPAWRVKQSVATIH